MQTPGIEARFNSILEDYGKLLRHAIETHCPRDMGLNSDDLMQEACLRLWRALSSEKEIQNVPSYLYRIAATVTIDAVRRVKARREEQMHFASEQNGALEERPESVQPVDARASPEVSAGHQQLMEIVKETLAGLLENRRRAVGLHLQGWNILEIAELMGWSEAKTRNLMYRGLDELRRQLRDQGFEYEVE